MPARKWLRKILLFPLSLIMGVPDAEPAGAAAPKSESFSREYVTELREENRSYRLRAQEAELKARAAEETALKAKAEAEAAAESRIKETVSLADQRIIRAELKALAVKEGLIDLDDLKLINLNGISLDENGEVQGAEELMKQFRAGKPHKFGQGNTSNPSPAPKPNAGSRKSAMEMTDEEYRREREKFMKRR